MSRAAVFKQARCGNPKSIGKKHGKNKSLVRTDFKQTGPFFKKKKKAGFGTCLFGLDIPLTVMSFHLQTRIFAESPRRNTFASPTVRTKSNQKI